MLEKFITWKYLLSLKVNIFLPQNCLPPFIFLATHLPLWSLCSGCFPSENRNTYLAAHNSLLVWWKPREAEKKSPFQGCLWETEFRELPDSYLLRKLSQVKQEGEEILCGFPFCITEGWGKTLNQSFRTSEVSGAGHGGFWLRAAPAWLLPNLVISQLLIETIKVRLTSGLEVPPFEICS